MAPNQTLAPLSSLVHHRDSHAPGKGPTAVPKPARELHNGDSQPAAKPALPAAAHQADDVDTDGEIDVDNCDDRECQNQNK